METINKRTLNDGYKVIGTISQIKAEQDTYLPVRSTSYGHGIYDYDAPRQMKFKYVATILTKLGTVELPVSKEFADELGATQGGLGSTLEITIVRK